MKKQKKSLVSVRQILASKKYWRGRFLGNGIKRSLLGGNTLSIPYRYSSDTLLELPLDKRFLMVYNCINNVKN